MDVILIRISDANAQPATLTPLTRWCGPNCNAQYI
jgi:hypothetical protein